MTLEGLEKVRNSVIRRYPISAGLALNGLELELSKEVSTAAVVSEKNAEGINEVKKIIVNPDFFDRLTYTQRVFVLAHEALHIALKHCSRSIDKPEKDTEAKYEEYCERETDENKRKTKRIVLHNHYHRIWNIATDACINAFLKRDGFDFPDNVIDPKTGKPMQFVSLKEGLIYSAEKIYDGLVKKEEEEKKQKEEKKNQDQNNNNDNNNRSPEDMDENNNQNQQQNNNNDNNRPPEDMDENNNQNQQQNNSDGQDKEKNREPDLSGLDDIDPDEYEGIDSHEEWNQSKENENADKKAQPKSEPTKKEPEDIDEEDILNKELENRQQEEKKGKGSADKNPFSGLRKKIGMNDIIPFRPVLSWKQILASSQQKIIYEWGKRRANKYNLNPRLEERVEDANPPVEVILDVSGSISPDLLRGFLLQLYPIFQTLFGNGEVSMKVGTFAGDFSGFQEIKSKEDILKFNPGNRDWTNFEVAATSFTKGNGEKPIKIVFTDGALDGHPSHVQKTRVPDIIWIVFGDNMDFTPLGGRIIHVSEKDYQDMLKSTKFFDMNENKGFTR